MPLTAYKSHQNATVARGGGGLTTTDWRPPDRLPPVTLHARAGLCVPVCTNARVVRAEVPLPVWWLVTFEAWGKDAAVVDAEAALAAAAEAAAKARVAAAAKAEARAKASGDAEEARAKAAAEAQERAAADAADRAARSPAAMLARWLSTPQAKAAEKAKREEEE